MGTTRDGDLWISIGQPALPLVLSRQGAAFGVRGFVHGRGARLAACRLRLVQGGRGIEARHVHLQTGMLGLAEAGTRAGLDDRIDGGFYVSAVFPGDANLIDGPATVEASLTWEDRDTRALRLCGVDLVRIDPLADPSTASGGRRVGIALATFEPDARLFSRQIASIRAQSHRDWVCVVSDDGSRPDRLAGIAAAIAGDPRFRLLEPGARLGFYRNFERACAALPEACGLVAFSDQDDAWRPDRLARGIAALGDLPFGCCYSDMTVVDAAGTCLSGTFWVHRRARYGSLGGLLLANVATGMTMLARRELVTEALPFPATPNLTYHDHWIALAAARRGTLRYVPEPLVAYVQHGANHTGALAAPEPSRALLRQAAGRIARLAATGLLGRAPMRAALDPGIAGWTDLEPARLRILADRLVAAGPPRPGDRALMRLAGSFGPLRLATCGADWGDRYRRGYAIELGSGALLKRLVLHLARRGRLHPEAPGL